MSWLMFEQIGKLKVAAEQCDFKVKLDIRDMVFIFPDGWKIDAVHLSERHREAITSWLTLLWMIRKNANGKKEEKIHQSNGNGTCYLQCNQG